MATVGVWMRSFLIQLIDIIHTAGTIKDNYQNQILIKTFIMKRAPPDTT
jgi:hypothetical protein